MILMSIMKISQLIKIHQINNISYTILRSITHKNLFILILYVRMNFIIKQIKSTTSVVIDFIMNTHNHNEFKVPKNPNLQNYTIPSQKKKNNPKNYI